jgi:cell division protein FtsB
VDAEKINIGRTFGSLLEKQIQSTLFDSGYINAFDSTDSEISPTKFVTGSKTGDSLKAEFDAFVIGSQKNFEKFSDNFVDSYSMFPPNEEGRHILAVEVKLNSALLMEWVEKATYQRNNIVFFDPVFQSCCRAVVINGGESSKDFIDNMHKEKPDEKYAACITKLKAARVNVFYKFWASGESFADLQKQNAENKAENTKIQAENTKIQAENAEIKAKNAIIEAENAEIKAENAKIQADINYIKLKLLELQAKKEI